MCNTWSSSRGQRSGPDRPCYLTTTQLLGVQTKLACSQLVSTAGPKRLNPKRTSSLSGVSCPRPQTETTFVSSLRTLAPPQCWSCSGDGGNRWVKPLCFSTLKDCYALFRRQLSSPPSNVSPAGEYSPCGSDTGLYVLRPSWPSWPSWPHTPVYSSALQPGLRQREVCPWRPLLLFIGLFIIDAVPETSRFKDKVEFTILHIKSLSVWCLSFQTMKTRECETPAGGEEDGRDMSEDNYSSEPGDQANRFREK